MKNFLDLTITKDSVGEALYHELREVCPLGKRQHVFGGHLPADDITVLAAMDLLARHGLQPVSSYGKREGKQFLLTYYREYEDADFESCEFLKVSPQVYFSSSAYRSSDGTLILKPPKKRIAGGYVVADFQPPYLSMPENDTFPTIVVCDQVRALVSEAGLRHIVLRPTTPILLRKPETAKPDSFAPYWEMTSDLILPHLGPQSVLIDGNGKPFTDMPGMSCHIREEQYWPEKDVRPVELHYERSAMDVIDEFDLARTSEMSGIRAARDWICSQRFYHFCCLHRLKMDWIPVRIEEM